MELYIGIKIIKAKPMNRQDYNDFRGWTLPSDEDGADDGYLVEYTDGGKPNMEGHEGYVSWSPKEQFHNAYRRTDGLTFGLAIEAAKKGKKIARDGWNASGMFVYRVPANSYPAQTEAAKKHFGDMVPYNAYFALKTAQNTVATWVPSSTDLDAEDWMYVD